MMNKQDILKKIGNIINELNEQHQYLSNTSKINILELELFTANADFLIDHIEILKKINNHVPELAAPAPAIITEVKETPIYPPVEEQKEEILIVQLSEKPEEIVFEEVNNAEEQLPIVEEETPAPLFKFDFEEPTEMVFDFEKRIDVKEVFDRELTVEEQNLIENKTKKLTEEEPVIIMAETEHLDDLEEEEIGEEPFIIKQPEAIETPAAEVKEEPIVAVPQHHNIIQKTQETEQPKAEKVPSLNEIFSGKAAERNSSTTNLKPITDLKSSISLNDKMFFIKELFNGYNLAYSEAIEILNRFDSFEAADNFLMKNYAEKNSWAAKQDTVDRLYEILNRKFKS